MCLSVGHRVSVMKTDVESDNVHDAFSKHCSDQDINISPSAPYLKEMNGEADRHFGALDMVRHMLETSGMDDVYWDMALQHATNLKNRLPSVPSMKWFLTTTLI